MDPEQNNTAFLNAALRELRLQLVAFARAQRGVGPEEGAAPQLESLRTEIAERARRDPPPPLERLTELFGLSKFERSVLLLAAAAELDRAVPSLCGEALGGDENAPTLGLCLELFDEPRWDILSPDRPLRRWQLLEILQRGSQPLTASPLRIDPRILHFLRGLEVRDERLASHTCPFDVDRASPLATSQAQLLAEIDAAWQAEESGPREREGTPPLFVLTGADRLAKQTIAIRLSRSRACEIRRLPALLLPSDPAQVELQARLWNREAALSPILLYVDAAETDAATLQRFSPLMRFLSLCWCVAWVDLPEPVEIPGRRIEVVDVSLPTRGEQHAAWLASMTLPDPGTARRLAGQFQFPLVRITEIAAAPSRRPAGSDREPLEAREAAESIWDRCREACRAGMDALARRIDLKAGWEDLVLPEEEQTLLGAIVGQVRHRLTVLEDWGFEARSNRGLGVTALFSGESGTGKTMAAEVIARDLRLDLYRIDLSQVVNKYIGETEKNLKRVFDAADASGAILFFDEADALFGKRSEVRDSHDRYANIEVNYLLQRMEGYRGLAILATNLKSSLDSAFLRRLRFVIDFPFPTASLRRRLWERVFPGATPLDGLDLDHLSKLHLAGGSIANIALNAAFAAAAIGAPVTMPAILAAAKAEYRKLQRPLNTAEFTWRRPGVLNGT